MKEVSIIIPHEALISSIEDARYLFSKVNEYLCQQGGSPVFHVKLVGLTREISLVHGHYMIKTDAVIQEVERPDLIIIPSINEEIIPLLTFNLKFNPWLIQNYQLGSEIASLCTGSFLLASTGLLKEKDCATHWQYANEFRAYFPTVKLVDDKIITEQKGIYTSGGSTSYWNLLLHLVEKYTDKSTAIWASKYFSLDISRNSQSQFAIFNGQKEHTDKEVLFIQEFIELHYGEKFTVETLAGKVNVARRTFERRFRNATHNSIIEYIQRVKIEVAKKQLEAGRKTAYEVMFDVGYTDMNAFREVFSKVAGLTPVEYRNKYNTL
ncbi:AraC family transcriptional regulator [Niastella koreensis]|uniref:Transcriptional regulator, AraC family n=2 Tax=Niastella koreensis TaxID=354356 RepID=G8TLS8_NIAKG|nr:helix-turn-helix domain-containing protein [Niastella koreensis]AEV97670.1 transcriptional regulator, AraC family [Niastella koreensis GR20-10]OQP40507.1 AraC family transcriptional regulator [Niastella koreensis]